MLLTKAQVLEIILQFFSVTSIEELFTKMVDGPRSIDKSVSGFYQNENTNNCTGLRIVFPKCCLILEHVNYVAGVNFAFVMKLADGYQSVKDDTVIPITELALIEALKTVRVGNVFH